MVINLLRDTTNIAQPSTGTQGGTVGVGTISDNVTITSGVNFLDSPASTSSVTYKTQVQLINSGTVNINKAVNGANRTSVSTITVMEIGA
jgi:hypothetical protein